MPRPFDVYLNWRGRSSRNTYWLFSIPLALLFVLSEHFLEPVNEPLFYLVLITLLIPSMMINIKRSHDRGRTGWFSLLLFVLFIGLWPMIEFGFLRGTEGSNRFGEPVLW